MTKDDLISAIAKKVGLSKNNASQSLSVILEEIEKALSRGEEVKLTGFGKFLVKESRGRKLPKFKAGRILKDAVK
ncbi:MAG: integration host factor subunit alpha [Candidatus Nealsonbacteria bacterium]|nr:MAG: integration host factor subunit alpha [Candidatus Nealsonbacteria bacterium]